MLRAFLRSKAFLSIRASFPTTNRVADRHLSDFATERFKNRPRLPGKLFDALVALFSEKVINLFQGEVARLRIAEVDQRDEGQVGAHEDEVGLPFQIVDDRRCNHDDYEILEERSALW